MKTKDKLFLRKCTLKVLEQRKNNDYVPDIYKMYSHSIMQSLSAIIIYPNQNNY